MASEPLRAEDLLRHGVFLRRLVRSMLHDRAEADDVLQDTWLAALERPPQHRSNLGGWLAVVARRLVLRRSRTKQRITRRERAAAQAEPQPSTVDVVATVEWHRAVASAVLRLGEPFRSAIVQRFHEGATLREVAARQGTSVATASSRVEEGIRRLRQDLDCESVRQGTAWRSALAPLVVGARRASWQGPTAALTKGVLVGTTTKGIMITAAVAVGSFLAGWHARPLAEVQEDGPGAATPGRVAPATLVGRTPSTPESTSAPLDAQDSPAGSPAEGVTPEAWLQRILEAQDPVTTRRVYESLAQLPPREGRDVLLTIYARIEPSDKRMQALQSWAGPPPHRYILALVHAASADKDLAVEQLALRFLPYFGLEDHGGDKQAYERWHEEHGERLVADLARETLLAWYANLRTLSGDALRAALANEKPPLHIRLQATDHAGVDSAALLRAEGALDLAATWLTGANPAIAAHGARWIAILGADVSFLRDHILPLVEAPRHHDADVMDWAYRALGSPGQAWAVDPLLRAFVETPRRRDWWSIAGALAGIGDRRAVPTMIAMIIVDDSYDSVYGIGQFGLFPLTGVPYRETQDAAWWRRWWAEERHRLGSDIASANLPSLQPVARDEAR